MKSAIIILNYNDYKTTAKLVDEVRNYSIPDHIVVVDNMSTDNSYEELSKISGDDVRVSVIKAPSNGGYAKGNNFGIRYAIKEYDVDTIFVANPDVSISEETFRKLSEVINQPDIIKDSKIGVVAPIVNQGANVWRLPGFIGMVESLFLVWFNIDKRFIKKKLTKSEKEVERVGVVEGSFFCISRNAYDAIDGLDENTFLYVEENILAKRLRNKGFCEAILTKERYDHFHSVSIKKKYRGSKAKAFHNFYNSMTYYNKQYLKTGSIRNFIFDIFYALAYFERIIYDIVKRFI